MNDVIKYNNGEIELAVCVGQDSVWLNQKQLAELFGVEVNTVNYHIKNIFRQKELEKNPTIQIFRIVQKEGNREIQRNVEHYNLDMIISLGYRVNSIAATKFRQWATAVLKEYITNTYAINIHKITEHRLALLENDVQTIKSRLKQEVLEPKQGVFFDGQIFDAYVFISGLLKKAEKRVILIDNYIDETTLIHLKKADTKVKITLLSKNISDKITLDIQKYNAQHNNLKAIKFESSHDRFLIIDDEIYHIGASLKDLGKKWFAFSLLEAQSFALLEKIEATLKTAR